MSCKGKLTYVDLDVQQMFVPPIQGPQFTLERCANPLAHNSMQLQQWYYNASWNGNGEIFPGTGEIYLRSPPSYYFPLPQYTCMDIHGRSTDSNATVYSWYCKGVANQQWQWNPENGTIVSLDGGGMCLQAGYPSDAPGSGWEGRLITTGVCDLTQKGQIFSWDTDPENTFGGFIKLVANPNFCIDAGHMGQTITWDPMLNEWARNPVTASTCPDAGQRPFLPRTFAEDYTVGYYRVGSDVVQERLVILDGDESDNNVWYSDDCGITWQCFDGDNPWSTHGRALSAMAQVPRNAGFPNNDMVMLGGIMYNNALNPACDAYYSPTSVTEGTGDGVNWFKMADLPGCPNVDVYSPGQLAVDGTNVYLFGEASWQPPNSVWQLAPQTLGPGSAFVQVQGANTVGSFGRKVWLRGASSGGCWFSTDFTAADVWSRATAVSSNAFSTAPTAAGPWTLGPTPPWTPRAGAGITASYDGTRVYLVGGLDFGDDGYPSGTAFNDAWSIDSSVCLYGANEKVCSGHGTANLDTVTCDCDDSEATPPSPPTHPPLSLLPPPPAVPTRPPLPHTHTHTHTHNTHTQTGSAIACAAPAPPVRHTGPTATCAHCQPWAASATRLRAGASATVEAPQAARARGPTRAATAASAPLTPLAPRVAPATPATGNTAPAAAMAARLPSAQVSAYALTAGRGLHVTHLQATKIPRRAACRQAPPLGCPCS